jgi:hypothetical protein
VQPRIDDQGDKYQRQTKVREREVVQPQDPVKAGGSGRALRTAAVVGQDQVRDQECEPDGDDDLGQFLVQHAVQDQTLEHDADHGGSEDANQHRQPVPVGAT